MGFSIGGIATSGLRNIAGYAGDTTAAAGTPISKTLAINNFQTGLDCSVMFVSDAQMNANVYVVTTTGDKTIYSNAALPAGAYEIKFACSDNFWVSMPAAWNYGNLGGDLITDVIGIKVTIAGAGNHHIQKIVAMQMD